MCGKRKETWTRKHVDTPVDPVLRMTKGWIMFFPSDLCSLHVLDQHPGCVLPKPCLLLHALFCKYALSNLSNNVPLVNEHRANCFFFWQPRPYQMTSHLIMHSSKSWSYSCGPILMSGCCDVCFRRWQDQTLAICPLALQSMPQLSSSSCCTKSSRVTLWSDTLMHSTLLRCV